MGEGSSLGLSRVAFAAWVATIIGVAAAQSIAHLVLVLWMHRLGTVLDLDRSNGLPDVVSSFALAGAAAGATILAHRERGTRRNVAAAVALALGTLTVADVLHDGAHPATGHGKAVIVLVCLSAALLVFVGNRGSRRVQVTLAVAACLLAGAFALTGLDRFDPWFQRERGDPVAEVRIVWKENFELVGWSLVALALWDAAAGAARGSSRMREVRPTTRAARADPRGARLVGRRR
jgi:hypothetical protein